MSDPEGDVILGTPGMGSLFPGGMPMGPSFLLMGMLEEVLDALGEGSVESWNE